METFQPLVPLLPLCCSLPGAPAGFDPTVFKDPPAEDRGTVTWPLNFSGITGERVLSGAENLQKQLYGGFFLVINGTSGKGLDPAYVKQSRPDFRFTEGWHRLPQPRILQILPPRHGGGEEARLIAALYTGERLMPAAALPESCGKPARYQIEQRGGAR